MICDLFLPMQRGIKMIWTVSKIFPFYSDRNWGKLFWQYCSYLMHEVVSIMYQISGLKIWETLHVSSMRIEGWEHLPSVSLIYWSPTLCWFSAVANYSFSEELTLARKTEFPFPEHQKETKYKGTWGDGVDLVSFSTSSCKMRKVTLGALYSPLHSAQMDDFST